MKYLLLVILASCTNGEMGKLGSYGESRSIKCWSGDRIIYSGRSTGKIDSEVNSDGYYFVEVETNKLIEVSGNCVIGQ